MTDLKKEQEKQEFVLAFGYIMFPTWISLESTLCEESTFHNTFQGLPRDVVIEICRNVCKTFSPSLASSVGPAVSNRASVNELTEESFASVDSEELVQYSMEVVAYALTLDFDAYEIIRDASRIYIEWLKVLLPEPADNIPYCIQSDPNLYAQRIFKSLCSLFVPRKGSSFIEKQCQLCHSVLRQIQEVAKSSRILDCETWDILLQTLLTMSNSVMSYSMEETDFSGVFARRLLSVLFNVWLVACQRKFPSAMFWKTFSRLTQAWNHRLALTDEWLKTTVLLFERTIHLMSERSGKNAIGFRTTDAAKMYSDWKLETLPVLPNDLLVQTLMRFMLLRDQIEKLGSSTWESASGSLILQNLSESQDTYDLGLPNPASQAFLLLRSMIGLTILADLAMNNLAPLDLYLDVSWNTQPGTAESLGTTSPILNATCENLFLLPKSRPLRCERRMPCRGILHLLGPYLFQVALSGNFNDSTLKSSSMRWSDSSLQNEIQFISVRDLELWQAGRSEALGTLCRLFSCFSEGPHIDNGLTARMALTLADALSMECASGFALTNVIRNSADILRSNVSGFSSLIPVFIPALETILLHKIPLKLLYPEVNADDLRLAAIHLLSSIICYPSHFKSFPIQGVSLLESLHRVNIDSSGSFGYRLLDLILGSVVIEANNSLTSLLLLDLLYVVFAQADIGLENADVQGVWNTYSNKVFTAVSHLLFAPFWLVVNDLSYAALEFFRTAARYSRLLTLSTKKLVVLTLCRYIQEQSLRKTTDHNKDLHNKIIVAYQSLTVWLHSASKLLQDAEVIVKVSEVIELGLSGPRAQNMLKTLQIMQPISMRVRDAAELSLLTLLEFTGMDSDPGFYRYLDNLVVEDDIKQSTNAVSSNFLYFVVDGAAVFAVLCPAGLTTGDIYVIQRSLSCRRAFQFSCQKIPPLFKRADSVNGENESDLIDGKQASVSVSDTITSIYADEADWDFMAFRNLIPGYNKIERCLADDMLPTFADINKGDENAEKDYALLMEVFDKIHDDVRFNVPDSKFHEPYKPPIVLGEVTRDSGLVVISQVLHHLGLKPPVLSLDSGSLTKPPVTVQLDHDNPNLKYELDHLDTLSIRPLDWMFSFYVKEKDRSIADILENGTDFRSCGEDFVRFFLSLGLPINVTDLLKRKWQSLEQNISESKNEPIRFDGQPECLIYTDISQELGILIPSVQSVRSVCDPILNKLDTSPEKQVRERNLQRNKPRSISMDDNESLSSKHSHYRPRKPSVLSESRFVLLVVWLETFQDDFEFPAREVLKCLDVDRLFLNCNLDDEVDLLMKPIEFRVIYVLPAAYGLYEIRLRNMDNNPIQSLFPLVNGLIVSHKVLTDLLLDCAINAFGRRRLAMDSYIPGQIRRRNFIEEISLRYRLKEITSSTWAP